MRQSTCEFREIEDLMIRDKIVFSVTDDRVREKLLAISDLSLSKAMPCERSNNSPS